MLRCVAVLSVFCSHIIFGYLVGPDYRAFTHKAFYAPLPSHFIIPEPLENFIFYISRFINFGPFGVGIFFLISGFLIPFSLKKTKPVAFLVQRAFRIFPVYWLSILMLCAAMAISAFSSGLPFTLSTKIITANALLLPRIFLGLPSIDYLNWTLEIELIFYLAAGFVMLWGSFRKIGPLFFIPAVFWVLMLILALLGKLSSYSMGVVSFFSAYMHLLSLGIGFYKLFTRRFSFKQFLLFEVFNFLLFLTLAYMNPWLKPILGSISINYIWAYLLFSLCYWQRERIPSLKIVNIIADLSYPIYLFHGGISFILMGYSYKFIPNWLFSLCVAIIWTGASSFLIYKYIETPFNSLGKKITSSFKF